MKNSYEKKANPSKIRQICRCPASCCSSSFFLRRWLRRSRRIHYCKNKSDQTIPLLFPLRQGGQAAASSLFLKEVAPQESEDSLLQKQVRSNNPPFIPPSPRGTSSRVLTFLKGGGSAGVGGFIIAKTSQIKQSPFCSPFAKGDKQPRPHFFKGGIPMLRSGQAFSPRGKENGHMN